jgi:hypothetical protein
MGTVYSIATTFGQVNTTVFTVAVEHNVTVTEILMAGTMIHHFCTSCAVPA